MARQAADILKKLLRADASGVGGSTIKSLALAPHVKEKKAVYAVVCETLRHLQLLKHIESSTGLLAKQQRLTPQAAYVLLYDLLLGQGIKPHGPAERAVLAYRDILTDQLAASKAAVGLKSAAADNAEDPWPRYVRVNLLKMTTQEALSWLRAPPEPHRAWKQVVRCGSCCFPAR